MLACHGLFPSLSQLENKLLEKEKKMANMHSVSALGFSLLNKFPHLILKNLILNPGVGISIISDYRWDS